jgi:tape measure domain-containing protein
LGRGEVFVSATVEERIVEMTFKGNGFAEGAQKAIQALTLLKDKLGNLKGSEQDINNLDAAGKKFSLSGMASGLEQVAGKFSALGITGITVLSNLVNRAVNAGISIAKSLTIDPIKAGLDVYETKINAIQTILANTGAAGTKLSDVTKALDELNKYANQTVYNFGQMAQNIGTFTAAGVDLKTSVASIKGIANLAALSGSSAEQASTAMYQLSQAIANGKVNLQDWNSVVNAGIGGKVFQSALEQTAKATGVNIDAIIKKAGSFRNSLQQGWLTSKILTQTLTTFTGDLTAAQLKGLGYTAAQTKAILAQAKAAQDSATKIRTITQLQAALREEVATAWSTVWQSLLGNINDATTLLSGVHTVLENLFTKPAYDLNALLIQFNKLGGRTEIIAAIKQTFSDLGRVLKPIAQAFREVFPPVTALNLMNIVLAFENFLDAVRLSDESMKKLKTTFVGIFSVVKIVFDVITGLGHSLAIMFGTAEEGSGSFLTLTSHIGQFLINVRKAIEQGDGLTKFFTALGHVLGFPVKAIELIVGALGGFSGAIDKAVAAIKPFVQKVGNVFKGLSTAIADGIKSGNFQNVVNIINQLLLGGVLVAIRNFIKNLGQGEAKGGGLFATIKESFEGLTGALKAMQTNLKSGTLEKIAISVALLTASLIALSFLDVNKLTKSLTAITVLFAEMLTALSVVVKVTDSAGIVKMAAIGVALNLLATAILILAGAVAILSQFSWAELERGLGAIAILLTELVAATLVMSANTKGLVASAYSLEVMAIALNILSAAVKTLGSLDFGTLVKGIGSIAALLVLMVAFQKFSGGKGLISSAVAMVLIGAALNVMANAIASLGKLSVKTLVKGIAAIAAVLLVLVVAMNVMEGSILGAAALVIVAAAVLILSKSLSALGALSWSAIAKAIVLLAGALVLLAAASIVMEASLPGAAALLVMAAALAVLTPVLIAFSQLSWEEIAKALVALAGTFVVIAAAGVLLAPLVVVLLALGAAILVMGTGILAAGAGVTLLAAGLTLMAVALTAAGAAIAAFVTTILGSLPAAVNEVANIILALAEGITKAGPALLVAIAAVMLAFLGAIEAEVPKATEVFGKVLVAILSTITKYSPLIVSTFFNLILTILNNIANYYPKFISAGISLLVNLLNGIARQIPKVAAAATNVIITFINAIGASELKIVAAGINMIVNFINGLAAEIRKDTPRLRNAGINLALAIIDGMTFGIFSGSGRIAAAARSVASVALNAAKSFLGINSPAKKFIPVGEGMDEGIIVGQMNKLDDVAAAAETVGAAALTAVQDSLSNMSDVVSSNIDLQPKITPILDLTQAKDGFGKLSSMSKSQLIAASASASTASSISADTAATANAISATGNATSVTYNQYNTSPTALDATTIYRQTKNQLSITRRQVTGANASGSN